MRVHCELVFGFPEILCESLTYYIKFTAACIMKYISKAFVCPRAFVVITRAKEMKNGVAMSSGSLT